MPEYKNSLTIFTKINYWQTKSRQEIDFILQKESKLYAIEVKWSKVTTYSLKRFKKIYPDAEIFTISMLQDFSGEESVLPAYLVQMEKPELSFGSPTRV